MPVGALSRHPVRDGPGAAARRRAAVRSPCCSGRVATTSAPTTYASLRKPPPTGTGTCSAPTAAPGSPTRRRCSPARTSWSPTPGRTRSPRRPRPADRRSSSRKPDPTTSSRPPAPCWPTAGRPSSRPAWPDADEWAGVLDRAAALDPRPLGRVVRRPGRRPVRRRGPGDPRAHRRRGCPMTASPSSRSPTAATSTSPRQHRSLARGTVRPDHYLAVAMDDPAIVEAPGRGAHPRGRRRRSRTRGRPAAGRRPQPRRPHRDRRRRRRGGAARRRLPGRRRPRGVVRRRGHGATGAHLVGTGDLPASPPAGRLPRRPGRPRGLGRPAPGATEPCARRAAGVRRPRPLLVAVLRRAPAHVGAPRRLLRGLRRLRRGGHRPGSYG